MNNRSTSRPANREPPLPAQMPTEEMDRSAIWVPCGIAIGKPFGLPRPRPTRSISEERGCGVSKRTIRPMPALGWEGRSRERIGVRVCAVDAL